MADSVVDVATTRLEHLLDRDRRAPGRGARGTSLAKDAH
jgi:hypothetical protein